jgi:hypothetical protein
VKGSDRLEQNASDARAATDAIRRDNQQGDRPANRQSRALVQATVELQTG